MRLFAASILLILTITNVSAEATQKVEQCTKTAMTAAQTLCQQNDQDCLTALQTIRNCFNTCGSGPDQSDSAVIKCAKTTCTTSNKAVQTWANNYISCVYLEKLSLSLLLLAIFAIVI
ncbi:hypothetical protein TTHERM_00185620 (macronuclear) [Tetrahymena thermophila SB210]|uniref:Transmembrane protein n=1 Tax=Tetrahymena thermophila (strain SB210) TaxID=312017 RepID=Q22T50_TETTS|nr:hypothetical protein TTHERM_00185620 [Tetrahymena thermophila SB210]EAR88588.1 hypothetical protein TTHERM_00185620 [Tetrahymena thermophila SB210]|eukprot:XP_001008833.1 hypothetical protein TTHERM_00185620 [Tetrahymena thermophila SB210]